MQKLPLHKTVVHKSFSVFILLLKNVYINKQSIYKKEKKEADKKKHKKLPLYVYIIEPDLIFNEADPVLLYPLWIAFSHSGAKSPQDLTQKTVCLALVQAWKSVFVEKKTT